MSIVYAMLQSNRMNELQLREKLLNEWSYLDSLTGLLNRRAYEREVVEASADGEVRIAFCDLNGLKKVNDKEGHQAGDRYLMAFSEILTRYFSHNSVFRISGDEFVVIAREISDEEFNSCINALRQDIEDNYGIASFGTAIGQGADIFNLIKEAEIKMYDDKENYYINNPENRRSRTGK